MPEPGESCCSPELDIYPQGVYSDQQKGMEEAMTGEALKDTADENAEAHGAGCCPCCCRGIHSHKMRTDEERRKLLNRLRRAEGQIRGVERMVEEDAYCPDIMVQIQAAISALNAFNRELLAAHIRGCVADDIRKGNDAVIDELARLTEKLMK